MTYRLLLKEELARRAAKNPKYSLSAFARQLGIGKASLSEVLSGKRDLAPSNVDRVVYHLGLSEGERERILVEIRQAKLKRLINKYESNLKIYTQS